MGLLDEAGNFFNRGLSSAERSAKSIQLKTQINDLNKKRESLAAQLGASLFNDTKDLPNFRGPRESLYVSIEDIDAKRVAIQEQLEALEQQARQASADAATFSCPTCGKKVSSTDQFCAGCGTPVEQIKQQTNACVACGTPMSADDSFCINCGTPVQYIAVAEPMPVPAPAPVAQNAAPQQQSYFQPQQTTVAAEPVEEVAQSEQEPVTEAAQPVETPVQETAPSAGDQVIDPDVTMPLEDFIKTSAGAQANMCGHCGFENIDAAVFCQSCGNRI